MVEQRQSALQRIQVGLVGLVVVLLFVSLANMVLDRVIDPSAISEAPGTSSGDNQGSTTAEAPTEPLAELGVTPVASEEAPTKDGRPPAAIRNVRPVPADKPR